jgi:hypothetical protein
VIAVVGGQTRNIGKTTLMRRLIEATVDLQWTAIKITQFGHAECSLEGDACGCAPGETTHPYALDEETEPGPADSQVYLAAGAAKSYWLRTRQGELAEAMPALRQILDGARHTIIESNSVLRFLEPDFYFPVIHPGIEDFKLSAQVELRRATRLVLAAPGPLPAAARGIPAVGIDGVESLAALIRQAAGRVSSRRSSPSSRDASIRPW